MIKIERINNLEYSFINSDSIGKKIVAKNLSFKNPDPFAYTQRIEMFDKKRFTFRIGMLNHLVSKLKKSDNRYEIFDYVYDQIEDKEIDSRLDGIWIHQRESVKEFYKRRFGILKIPTRAGKTFTTAEILRLFLKKEKEGNFLFIVDTVDLFNQAKNDFNEFFKKYGGIKIGEICAGRIDLNERVTIAMIQTIQSCLNSKRNSNRKKLLSLKKYIKNLSFLAIDEIHDNCSDSKLSIYKNAKNLEYLLCLSATPYRSEAFYQNLKLKAWSGDIFYEVSESTLRKRGVLSDYMVFLMLIDHNNVEYEIDNENYQELKKKLIIENKIRDDVLFRILDILKVLNLKTLVLFQSVEHGKIVSEATGHPFISGESKTEERGTRTLEFLKGDGDILLASNIYKKGITLPEAQVLVNVDGGLEKAGTIQRKGRVLGTTENKNKSIVIDFLDVYDAYFSEHSEARLDNYVSEIGEKKVGILDVTADDCFETLEKWLIKWFEL